MKLPKNVIIDDKYHCTAEDMEMFKASSKIWKEIESWIKARRETLQMAMDAAEDMMELKLLNRERKVLGDLLNLPELVIQQLEHRDKNDEIEELTDEQQGHSTE